MANYIIQLSSNIDDFSIIYERVYLPVLGKLVSNNTDKTRFFPYFRFMANSPSLMTLIEMYGILHAPNIGIDLYNSEFSGELFEIENYMIANGVPHSYFLSSGEYHLRDNSEIAKSVSKRLNNEPQYKRYFQQLGIHT